MAGMGQDRLQGWPNSRAEMKPNIHFVKAYARARRTAWSKLNNGDPLAKLPPQDARHDLHARLMDRLHARVLIVLNNRQN
jgi:hypothetical protein